MALTNFPAVIAALLQQGFLVREMEEGLDSILAYRGLVTQETFPGRIGESMTRTRKGRRAPVTTALTPSGVNAGIDNGLTTGVGLTSGAYAIEQYVFTLFEYADTVDLNLMQEQAGIADQFIALARNNGVQAAQSLERICRAKLFGAYMGGNTRCITLPVVGLIANGVANSQTKINVDDIRGFTTVISNGVPTPVAVGTPLAIILTKTNTSAGDGTSIALSVTSALAYSSATYGYQSGKSAADITTTPDAVPGVLTTVTGSGYTPLTGDTIVAVTAPAVFRPAAKPNALFLTGGDVFSLAIVLDSVAYLRDNGVPPMNDGTYHCILDNTSMRQLFADSDFKALFAGRNDTSEYKNSDVVRLLGVTFIPTTEAYVQTQTTFDGTNLAATGVRVRRPIVCGGESIIQGNFEGMESWLSERGFDRSDSNIVMVDGVLQIVREPLDRLQQLVAMSWTWIGDFAVPTDITADSTIIPTASNALYKRCVVVEHAG